MAVDETLSLDFGSLSLNPDKALRSRAAADAQRKQTARQLQTPKRPGKRRRKPSDELFASPRHDTDAHTAPISFTFVLPEWCAKWSKLASYPHQCRRFEISSDALRNEECDVSAAKKLPIKIKRYAFAPFRFLDLPRELRDAVYSFALRKNSDSRLFLSTDRSKRPKISRMSPASHALLSTSRQFYDEGLPILYRTNDFYSRCIKLLPALICSLGSGQKHIRRLELSFVGKTSKTDIFNVLNSVHKLHQLRELELAFDYGTLKQLQEAFNRRTLKRLCEHKHIHGGAFNRYKALMGSLSEWRRTRRLRLVFRGSEEHDHKRSIHATPSPRDCIPCGVMKGLEGIRDEEKEEKEAEEVLQSTTSAPFVVIMPRMRSPVVEEGRAQSTAPETRPILSPER